MHLAKACRLSVWVPVKLLDTDPAGVIEATPPAGLAVVAVTPVVAELLVAVVEPVEYPLVVVVLVLVSAV